jgi:hypothetical protein
MVKERKLTQAIFQARRCGVEQPTSLTQTKEDWAAIPRTTRTKRAWIRRTYQMKRSVRREDFGVVILQAESSVVYLTSGSDSAEETRLPATIIYPRRAANTRNHSGAPEHPTPYHPTPQHAECLCLMARSHTKKATAPIIVFCYPFYGKRNGPRGRSS